MLIKNQILCALGLLTMAGRTITASSGMDSDSTQKALTYFNTEATRWSSTTNELYLAVKSIDSVHAFSIANAKHALAKARVQYKRIAFFLDYFLPHQAWMYNAASKFEVEEPFKEYEAPHGFQYMEELLFADHPARERLKLEQEAMVIKESSADIKSLFFQLPITSAQILASIRIELVRIISLYTTGYDAPYLKSGLKESESALRSMQGIIALIGDQKMSSDSKLLDHFLHCIAYLQRHPTFDDFNRLAFLCEYATPLAKELELYIRQHGLAIKQEANANEQLISLLWGNKLSGNNLSSNNLSQELIISLGKKLFSDKNLSGHALRSCETCHQPEKYFTDGLANNLSLNKGTALKRNTPTLLYSGFQSSQFWDGRAKGLNEQLMDVLTNPEEMNGHLQEIVARINKDMEYRALFQKAFNIKPDSSIKMDEMAMALTSYVRGLSPANSDFDRYVQGDKSALTIAQQKGFNLFMGKGQCGTCHFMPLFNGLIPPDYDQSDYEVLGIPSTDNFKKPVLDSDSGRYTYFQIPFYLRAFKTPTLRNIAKTGPYMHNGKMKTLSKVLEFYNSGGAVGLGMHIDNQTLSSRPLHLTKTEMNEIILFLNALTDRLPNDQLNAGHSGVEN